MARIDNVFPDEAIVQKAALVNVGLISAQGYYLTTPKMGEFIFGYSGLHEIQIEEGIEKLSQIFKY
jgi:GntR family transcriptional regulator / MocR family aminotransferase